MYLGQEATRNRLVGMVDEMVNSGKSSEAFIAAAKAFKDTMEDGEANAAATKELIAQLEDKMRKAAKMLEYEIAAELRDEIIRLRGEK